MASVTRVVRTTRAKTAVRLRSNRRQGPAGAGGASSLTSVATTVICRSSSLRDRHDVVENLSVGWARLQVPNAFPCDVERGLGAEFDVRNLIVDQLLDIGPDLHAGLRIAGCRQLLHQLFLF